MVNQNQLLELVKRAREGATTRNFNQSAELTVTLKDIDIKKGFSLNEVVAIPHNPNKKPSVCVIATGEPAMQA
jgi:large subunit ribosomal protein L1